MELFEDSKYNNLKSTLHGLGEVPKCIVTRIVEFTVEDDRCEGCLLYRGEQLSFAEPGILTCAACKAEERTLICKKRAKRTFKSLTDMDFLGSPEYVVRDVHNRKKDYYRVKDLKQKYDRTSKDVTAAKMEWKCLKVTKRMRKWKEEEAENGRVRKRLKLSQQSSQQTKKVKKKKEANPAVEEVKIEANVAPEGAMEVEEQPQLKGKEDPEPVDAINEAQELVE